MPIPSELLEYKQWVLWRRTQVNGRIAKLPISPWSGKVASCDKPQTWSTYRHVCYARRTFGPMGSDSSLRPSIRSAVLILTIAGP